MSARPVGRSEVLALADAGLSYEEIGARLGVSPGLAYLLRTGIPADGSDAPSEDARSRPGSLAVSQQLSNPQPADNPTAKQSVLEWVQQRVSSDQPMRRADASRSLAPPPDRRVDGPVDLVDVLGRTHASSTVLLKELAALPGVRKHGSPDRLAARGRIIQLVADDLPGHQQLEERELWPLVRDRLEDGEQLADHGLEAGARTREVVSRLTRLRPDQDEFDELVEELTALSRQHVAFTAPIFLRLRDRVPEQLLIDLAEAGS